MLKRHGLVKALYKPIYNLPNVSLKIQVKLYGEVGIVLLTYTILFKHVYGSADIGLDVFDSACDVLAPLCDLNRYPFLEFFDEYWDCHLKSLRLRQNAVLLFDLCVYIGHRTMQYFHILKNLIIHSVKNKRQYGMWKLRLCVNMDTDTRRMEHDIMTTTNISSAGLVANLTRVHFVHVNY
jgi:hypothetical protein